MTKWLTHKSCHVTYSDLEYLCHLECPSNVPKGLILPSAEISQRWEQLNVLKDQNNEEKGPVQNKQKHIRALHTFSLRMWLLVQLLSHVWLCNPMDCSMPGFPVLHYLLDLAQTHVHWVSDAIQPSHPLLPLSPSALNHSQHQGLFEWVGSSHQVAKVLELQF